MNDEMKQAIRSGKPFRIKADGQPYKGVLVCHHWSPEPAPRFGYKIWDERSGIYVFMSEGTLDYHGYEFKLEKEKK